MDRAYTKPSTNTVRPHFLYSPSLA